MVAGRVGFRILKPDVDARLRESLSLRFRVAQDDADHSTAKRVHRQVQHFAGRAIHCFRTSKVARRESRNRSVDRAARRWQPAIAGKRRILAVVALNTFVSTK